MLDSLVVLIVFLAVIIGYKRGLIRTVVSLASYVVSLILAWILHPFVAGFLQNSFLMDMIHNAVKDNYIQPHASQISAQSLNLPSFFDNVINSGVSQAANNAAEVAAQELTLLIISIIAIILTFILCHIIIMVAAKVLNIFGSLPIIRQFNRLGGGILGLLQGILIVYALFAVISVWTPVNQSDFFVNSLQNASFSKQMYNDNVIFNLISPQKNK